VAVGLIVGVRVMVGVKGIVAEAVAVRVIVGVRVGVGVVAVRVSVAETVHLPSKVSVTEYVPPSPVEGTLPNIAYHAAVAPLANARLLDTLVGGS